MIGIVLLRNGREYYASEWNGALLIDQTNTRRAQGVDMGIIKLTDMDAYLWSYLLHFLSHSWRMTILITFHCRPSANKALG